MIFGTHIRDATFLNPLHISRLNGKTRLNRCKIGIGGIWQPYLSQKISENNRAVKSEL